MNQKLNEFGPGERGRAGRMRRDSDISGKGPSSRGYWPFSRGSTEIWYAKNPTWDTQGTENFRQTHVLLGTVSETDPERIYMMMQGENWSPEGEARELIMSKGLSHTSMSMGDVVVVGGKAFVVDTAGFKSLGESRISHIVNRLLEDTVEIASWVSRSGKDYVHLSRMNGSGTDGSTPYSYTARGAGGVLYAKSDQEAVAQIQVKVDSGYFLPDAAKTPMKRSR